MKAGNFATELAEFRVAQECNAGIARIQNALKGEGETDCVVCDRPIPAQRLAAYPSARRCIACQSQYEENMRRSA